MLCISMKMPKKKKNITLLGCSIGNCVHIAGVANFFHLAETYGFKTILLGAAIEPHLLIEQIEITVPDAVCISYRLSPVNCRHVLENFQTILRKSSFDGKLLFGGTQQTVAVAKELDMFDYYFIGEEPITKIIDVFEQLTGKRKTSENTLSVSSRPPIQEAVDNLPILNEQGLQMPLLRHHFGLPSIDETIKGAREISQAEVLDVISIAPDQNSQQFFFHPEKRNPKLDGAGGVPIHKEKDLSDLNQASKCGNFPYLRIYSGTQDLLKWAELSVRTIDNAWGTIPLCWYSELDGRSSRPLLKALEENMSVIKWYAQLGKPVEINESHHWSLRNSPDVVAVAMAYIAAYTAKKLGVRQYFAQYMLNNPSFTSIPHDLAKIGVENILVKSLESNDFHVYRQLRAGLAHFSVDSQIAKGQLAVSTATMLNFNPHIVHIVSFTEGDHAALANEVIESAKIVRGVIRNLAPGIPNAYDDSHIKQKAEKLLFDAQILLSAVKMLGEKMESHDPLSDPKVIAQAIQAGIFDAPQLRGQKCIPGDVKTLPKNGGCVAVDASGKELDEYQRLREPAKRLKLDFNKIKKIQPFLGNLPLGTDKNLKFLS